MEREEIGKIHDVFLDASRRTLKHAVLICMVARKQSWNLQNILYKMQDCYRTWQSAFVTRQKIGKSIT